MRVLLLVVCVKGVRGLGLGSGIPHHIGVSDNAEVGLVGHVYVLE
jgi:hypothetical protein